MADFMRCNACGTVFKGELSLATSCPNTACKDSSNFTLVGAWGGALGANQTLFTGTAPTDIRVLAKKLVDGKCTTVSGIITVNYKSGTGKLMGNEQYKTRGLQKALERIAEGKPMPIDAFGNTHNNDGQVYRNRPGRLPVADADYYREYGVLVDSRGWEVRVSSERLVAGRCWDLYYTSHHYDPGSWWVFNTVNGTWSLFGLA